LSNVSNLKLADFFTMVYVQRKNERRDDRMVSVPISPSGLKSVRQEYIEHVAARDNPESFRLVKTSPLGSLAILAKIGDAKRPKRQAARMYYCAACNTVEKFWKGGCYLCSDGTARLVGHNCENDERIRKQQLAADRAFGRDQRQEMYTRLSERLEAALPVLMRAFSPPAATITENCLRDIDAEVAKFAREMPQLFRVVLQAAEQGGTLAIQVASWQSAASEALSAPGRRAQRPQKVLRTVFRTDLSGAAVLRHKQLVSKWRRAGSGLHEVGSAFGDLRAATYEDDESQRAFEKLGTDLEKRVREVRSLVSTVAAAIDFFTPRNLSRLADYATDPRRDVALLRGEYFWDGRALTYAEGFGRESSVSRPATLRPLSISSLEEVEAVCGELKKFLREAG
jgi:hypothetical protein